MVYQRASSGFGVTSSRISFGMLGAISAMPISSGSSFASLLFRFWSSIDVRLGADNTTHRRSEHIIEEAYQKRDERSDEDHDERVTDGSTVRWPYDVRELFANLL